MVYAQARIWNFAAKNHAIAQRAGKKRVPLLDLKQRRHIQRKVQDSILFLEIELQPGQRAAFGTTGGVSVGIARMAGAVNPYSAYRSYAGRKTAVIAPEKAAGKEKAEKEISTIR